MSDESKHVPDGFMWFRRRRGDYEEEAIGKPDDIQRLFLNGKHSPKHLVKVEQPLLPMFGEEQEDSLLSSQGTSESSASANDGDESDISRQPSSDDFIRFYREKSPRNQSEQGDCVLRGKDMKKIIITPTHSKAFAFDPKFDRLVAF